MYIYLRHGDKECGRIILMFVVYDGFNESRRRKLRWRSWRKRYDIRDITWHSSFQYRGKTDLVEINAFWQGVSYIYQTLASLWASTTPIYDLTTLTDENEPKPAISTTPFKCTATCKVGRGQRGRRQYTTGLIVNFIDISFIVCFSTTAQQKSTCQTLPRTP